MIVTITIEKVSRREMEKLKEENMPDEASVCGRYSFTPDWSKPLHGITLAPEDNLSRPFQGYRTIKIYILDSLGKEATQRAIAHEMYHAVQWLTSSEMEEENIVEVENQMVKALKKRKRGAIP